MRVTGRHTDRQTDGQMDGYLDHRVLQGTKVKNKGMGERRRGKGALSQNQIY